MHGAERLEQAHGEFTYMLSMLQQLNKLSHNVCHHALLFLAMAMKLVTMLTIGVPVQLELDPGENFH